MRNKVCCSLLLFNVYFNFILVVGIRIFFFDYEFNLFFFDIIYKCGMEMLFIKWEVVEDYLVYIF